MTEEQQQYGQNEVKLMDKSELKEQTGLPSFESLQTLSQELDNNPAKTEIKTNKHAGNSKYIPIERIESKLNHYFPMAWQTSNFQWQVIANEIVCSIELEVYNGHIGCWIKRTGAGAAMIQTYKNSDFTDTSNKIQNTLQKDFPNAKAEAFKNAAKSIGKAFGRDLNREFENEATTFFETQTYIDLIGTCESVGDLNYEFQNFPENIKASKQVQNAYVARKNVLKNNDQ